MAVSMRQLAKIAGVSVATVSYALRDDPRISAATRQRIQSLARKHNCRVNVQARGFFEGRSFSIAVIVPDIRCGFYPPILQGIERVAADRGYTVCFANSYNDPQTEAKVIHTYMQHRIDGLIVAPISESADNSHFLELQREGVPIVVIDRRLDFVETDFVGCDDYAGAFAATEYLISMGHRYIAHITGSRDAWTTIRRKSGYSDALKRSGIELPEGYSVEVDYLTNALHGFSGAVSESVKALFQMEPRPTALFVSNDLLAIEAYGAIRRLGYRIPDDVSVVGFADLDISQYIDPPLTTVHQPAEKMGEVAANILIDKIEAKGSSDTEYRGCISKILEVELKIRKSVARVSR